LGEFTLSVADEFSCDLPRSSALFLLAEPGLWEAVMGKAGGILPFGLLATFFGFQSAATAGTITFATGSMQLEACDVVGNCLAVNPPIQFPPDTNTQQIYGPNPDMSGTSVATATIGFQASSSPNQSPTASATAYVTGYPGSQANVLLTLGFEFIPLSGTAPSTVSGTVSGLGGGVQDNEPVSGDIAYASVAITEQTATPSTVFSACAVVGSISSPNCAGVTASTFSISPQSISFTPNQIYTLQLAISLSFDNYADSQHTHNANATIDPFIVNNDPSDFQLLLVSPNITATPLPSTWTMMLIGFGGLCFFTYRGTKKNAAALSAA
jgi:hypothetical protein